MTQPDLFRDRADAGRQVALRLSAYAHRDDVSVVGLPRGGVPVAAVIAAALAAPLDICAVRKLGVPGQPELAMGAIAEGGIQILNRDLVAELGLTDADIAPAVGHQQAELMRRLDMYTPWRRAHDLRGRTVILVDDGLATGATMEAAIASMRSHAPARVVVAVPVGAADTCRRLQSVADEVVCLRCPEPFYAVGQWYERFTETTDDEVMALLRNQPF